MENQLNINIRIAGQEPIPLTINRDDEETAREAERHVNRLFSNYSQRYKFKGTSTLLAMVAYRFAELLVAQNAQMEKTEAVLNDFEASLDAILLDVGEQPPSDNAKNVSKQP